MGNARITWTLALVFLAGVATGMVGMRYGLHDGMHQVMDNATAARATGDDAVLEHFRSELNLTNDQTQRLALVLDDYRHYYESVQDQIEDLHLRDQIDDLRSTGKSRILDILNEDQRVKFEQMTNEMSPAAEGTP